MSKGKQASNFLKDGADAYADGDYDKALKLFLLAAAQGLPEAYFNAGHMVEEGLGVAPDPREAAKLYREAAILGNARAQYNLGVMYERGQGIKQSWTEAVKWYRAAAEQGEPNAQLNLGASYGEGTGVPQDYVLAHMWLNLAAASFAASDTQSRQKAVRSRDLVARVMTPQQLAEAQQRARNWKSK